MIVYGFAKDYRYDGDGTLQLKVRIPSIHGPYIQTLSKQIYIKDKDLPWYNSILLPSLPVEGDVVALANLTDGKGSQFIVIGLTGGNYNNGARI
jgi:hypothetical protein